MRAGDYDLYNESMRDDDMAKMPKNPPDAPSDDPELIVAARHVDTAFIALLNALGVDQSDNTILLLNALKLLRNWEIGAKVRKV